MFSYIYIHVYKYSNSSEFVGVTYCFICSQFIENQARNSSYTRVNIKIENQKYLFCIFDQILKKIHILLIFISILCIFNYFNFNLKFNKILIKNFKIIYYTIYFFEIYGNKLPICYFIYFNWFFF
jgi:hypothetical protein